LSSLACCYDCLRSSSHRALLLPARSSPACLWTRNRGFLRCARLLPRNQSQSRRAPLLRHTHDSCARLGTDQARSHTKDRGDRSSSWVQRRSEGSNDGQMRQRPGGTDSKAKCSQDCAMAAASPGSSCCARDFPARHRLGFVQPLVKTGQVDFFDSWSASITLGSARIGSSNGSEIP
jgi:hypothetical protein